MVENRSALGVAIVGCGTVGAAAARGPMGHVNLTSPRQKYSVLVEVQNIVFGGGKV